MNGAPVHPADVLVRLKAETRAEHTAVEGALDLMRADFSMADYRHLIECYFGFYAPLEAQLARVLPADQPGLDFEARRKLPLLRADLEALGGPSPDSLAVCDALPPLRSPAQAMGCLYVLEGAMLGGQTIGRHLRHKFGLTQDAGASYFHGSGARTADVWRSFRDALTSFAAHRELAATGATATVDAIVESGNQTFRALRLWCVRDRIRLHRSDGPTRSHALDARP
jgi:heme oxygenase